MKTHDLKCWPIWFDAIEARLKTFDIRRDDRGYEVGDRIVFHEYRNMVGSYTGRTLARRIGFIMRGVEAEKCGLQPGYAGLGLIDDGVSS